MPAAYNNLGNALGRQGDKASALEQFRAAVRLDPTSAEARGNLGRMLLEQGEPNEAFVHCREAVRIRPDFAAAEAGELYGPGLALMGLPLARLVILEVPRPRDALWAMEEALQCRAAGAVHSFSTAT